MSTTVSGYPQSHATASDITTELNAVAGNQRICTSCYLDTVQSMSESVLHQEDHHQGLARTHKLSDGSIYFFLSHSHVGSGKKGNLSQYRYDGHTQGDHILDSDPLTVAPMKQLLVIDEQHPSDITFLPDIGDLDAGYLFVTDEYDQHGVTIYRWEPDRDLMLKGRIWQGFPLGGPNFVFIDRDDDVYYLGIASNNWGWGKLFCAGARSLFPESQPGSLEVSAIVPAAPESLFPFPLLGGACQNKLIRDATGQWYLLAYRSDPDDDVHGTDYVDIYGVRFSPFMISYRLNSVHVSFKAGETGFANTGTHYVEESGRLLISSSYRYARDEGPGDSSYVSRVDELPSS
jgi:hypothetical protein